MICTFGQGSNSCDVCGEHAPDPSLLRNCTGVRVAIGYGPGTELRAILAGWPFFITSTPDCSCSRIAAQMDEWGVEGCLIAERMAYIVAAMRENAKARGYLFFDFIGRLLIKRAVSIAASKTA
jgi:hypothetical protein